MRELAERVGRALKSAGVALVTAESCTGGWVAQVLTAVPGASEWFERGFVTYSDAAKEEMLGVPRALLERQGAVSEETAREMALGALRHSRATLAVAVTGIAGPAGGTPARPVGLVCFAWARRDEMRSESRHFAGDREKVRLQSVEHALKGLLALLGARSG